MLFLDLRLSYLLVLGSLYLLMYVISPVLALYVFLVRPDHWCFSILALLILPWFYPEPIWLVRICWNLFSLVRIADQQSWPVSGYISECALLLSAFAQGPRQRTVHTDNFYSSPYRSTYSVQACQCKGYSNIIYLSIVYWYHCYNNHN